jgi:hypothetical protein
MRGQSQGHSLPAGYCKPQPIATAPNQAAIFTVEFYPDGLRPVPPVPLPSLNRT